MRRSFFLIAIGILPFIIVSMSKATDANKNEIRLVYGQEIVVSPDKFWADKDLKKKFTDYWGFRLAGNIAEAFKIEAPYVQEMVNYKRYESFLKKVKDGLDVIKLRKQIRRTEHLIEFHASIMDGKDEIAGLRDTWVFVNGKWYHVFEDRLILPDDGSSFLEEVPQKSN